MQKRAANGFCIRPNPEKVYIGVPLRINAGPQRNQAKACSTILFAKIKAMKSNPGIHLIALAGPTASGKTKLAASLARKYNLPLISADSRQVYRGMDIGTGKDLHLLNSDKNGPVRHYLIDVADPAEIYSLFHYQKDVYAVLARLIDLGERAALLVGGTGLYIESVLGGYQLSEVGENPAFREQMNFFTLEELRDQLKAGDPKAYGRTDLTSKKRVIRALEISAFSKTSAHTSREPLPEFDYRLFCLTSDKETLHKKIKQRLLARLSQGMVAEVEGLLKAGLSPARMEMLGLEYRIISRHIQNGTSEENLIQTLHTEICRTAKSQQTRFRGFEKRGLPATWIAEGTENLISDHIEAILNPN